MSNFEFQKSNKGCFAASFQLCTSTFDFQNHLLLPASCFLLPAFRLLLSAF